MLGALAAVVLVVGTISATVSVNENGRKSVDGVRESVVEIESTEDAETASAEPGRL
jgi:hypothetical protein